MGAIANPPNFRTAAGDYTPTLMQIKNPAGPASYPSGGFAVTFNALTQLYAVVYAGQALQRHVLVRLGPGQNQATIQIFNGLTNHQHPFRSNADSPAGADIYGFLRVNPPAGGIAGIKHAHSSGTGGPPTIVEDPTLAAGGVGFKTVTGLTEISAGTNLSTEYFRVIGFGV